MMTHTRRLFTRSAFDASGRRILFNITGVSAPGTVSLSAHLTSVGTLLIGQQS